LGHEVTHITHRHSIRQLRDARNKHAIAQVFSTVTTVAGAAALGGLGSALGGLTGSMGDLWVVTAVSGYSRELEAEADQRGLERMARAGYDECEAPRIFEHLVEAAHTSRAQESYLYSTHPRLMVRLGNYLNLLGPRCARGARDSTPPPPDGYEERVATLVLDNAALNFDLGRMEPAEAGVERHLRVRPASARGHLLHGRIHQRRFRAAEAIAEYAEAARLDSTYAEPHRELGLLYVELKRPDQARAALRRYLALAPDAPDAAAVERKLTELAEP
jgi:predicted Zn-dependent protease